MQEEARKTIERNVISNRVLPMRLKELVLRHCANRNVRLHGRTVDLVREWFADYPYSAMNDEETIAFQTRSDILNWATALMVWPGWEAFLDRMMSAPHVGGTVQAYFLYLALALHGMPNVEDGRNSECSLLDDLDDMDGDNDPAFLWVFKGYWEKSDLRLLMESDLTGLEWMSDRVAYADRNGRATFLAKLFENRLDALAEYMTPNALAAFSLKCDGCLHIHLQEYATGEHKHCANPQMAEETVANGLRNKLQIAAALSRRWPDVYDSLYRGHRDMFVRMV